MNSKIKLKNRRSFLKNSLVGAAGLASSSLLWGCSTFDENLFDDRRTFTDEVIIVGGGLSGLYLAYKLREAKTEFRLFEGGHSFGGRLKSNLGIDYGASVLSNSDTLSIKLAEKLGVRTAPLQIVKTKDKYLKTKKAYNKDHLELLYLPEGMQTLSDALFEKIVGLLPYRNFKLRWRLIEIHKFRAGYELIFENPSGQKRIYCTKVALAIPPTQWGSIKGLLTLPEMAWAREWLMQLSVENTIKIILPSNSVLGPQITTVNDYLEITHENLNIRQVHKRNTPTSNLEIDVRYVMKKSVQSLDKQEISIDHIYSVVKKKLQLNYPFQKLAPEFYYDWSQVKLIGGSGFKNENKIPHIPNPNFQIMGDFMDTSSRYTIEAALQSVNKASELLL